METGERERERRLSQGSLRDRERDGFPPRSDGDESGVGKGGCGESRVERVREGGECVRGARRGL